jgi:hypothetical protein
MLVSWLSTTLSRNLGSPKIHKLSGFKVERWPMPGILGPDNALLSDPVQVGLLGCYPTLLSSLILSTTILNQTRSYGLPRCRKNATGVVWTTTQDMLCWGVTSDVVLVVAGAYG